MFIKTTNLWLFNDYAFTFTDLLAFSNINFYIALIIFCISSTNPFILLLSLEIMYLNLNFNFILFWLFNASTFSPVYVLIILGITAAESVVGLAIIVHLNKLGIINFNQLVLKKVDV